MVFARINPCLFLLILCIVTLIKSVNPDSLTPEQSRLIMDYYNQKYKAQLSCDTDSEFFKKFKNVKNFFPEGTRLMWMFGIDGGHATPLFYFKEDGEEAFFLYDSLGANTADLSSFVCIVGNEIPFYYIRSPRQADRASCFMDSLLMGKYVTGHNKDGSKKIPHLLSFLKQHSTAVKKKSRCYVVEKLPALLLKTAQRKLFIHRYFTDESRDFLKTNGNKVSFDSFLQNGNPYFDFMGHKTTFLELKNLSMRRRFGRASVIENCYC